MRKTLGTDGPRVNGGGRDVLRPRAVDPGVEDPESTRDVRELRDRTVQAPDVPPIDKRSPLSRFPESPIPRYRYHGIHPVPPIAQSPDSLTLFISDLHIGRGTATQSRAAEADFVALHGQDFGGAHRAHRIGAELVPRLLFGGRQQHIRDYY